MTIIIPGEPVIPREPRVPDITQRAKSARQYPESQKCQTIPGELRTCKLLSLKLLSSHKMFLDNVILGGLSLHLNHLIASHVANYDWPFGTLPFGLFGSNLDTRDLETYPSTYSGHIWNMSIFDDSRAIWVLFRKSHFTWKRMAHTWIFRFGFRRRSP